MNIKDEKERKKYQTIIVDGNKKVDVVEKTVSIVVPGQEEPIK